MLSLSNDSVQKVDFVCSLLFFIKEKVMLLVVWPCFSVLVMTMISRNTRNVATFHSASSINTSSPTFISTPHLFAGSSVFTLPYLRELEDKRSLTQDNILDV